MTHLKTFITTVALLSTLLACGESKDDDKDSSDESGNIENLPEGFGKLAIDSGINQLPSIVEPVSFAEDTATSDFDSDTGSLQIDTDFSIIEASTGIGLDSGTTDASFNGKSYAACRMVNRARGFFHFAAVADGIDCELGFILGDSDLFFDGKAHTFAITEEEDGETLTTLYKIKIDGPKDNVKAYTLQRCEAGKQDLFLRKSIDEDNNATIVSKRYSEPENPEVDKFWALVTVGGAVDDAGKFTGLKTIDQDYSNLFANGVKSYVKEEVIQSSKNFQYTGFMQQDDKDWDDKFLAFVQLIDKNAAGTDFTLENYFLGNGAMAYNSESATDIVQGWDGDSKSVNNDTSSPYVKKINDARSDLPGSPSPQTLTFVGDEILDCDSTPELTIKDEDLYAAYKQAKALALDDDEGEDDFCSGYQLPQNSYLQCSGSDQTGI